MSSKDIEEFYRIAATLNDEHRAIAARHQRMATSLAKLYELLPPHCYIQRPRGEAGGMETGQRFES